MKNMIRIALFGLVFCVLLLSSCSFGFVPSWKQKEKATISLQFATLDSIARSADGTRAIIQGDGFLYIRTFGGPNGDKGPLYGPYRVSSGSTFETTDIPAGNYSEGIGVIYSAIELGAFEAILKLPEDEFMSEIESTEFLNALSGIASSGMTGPKVIKASQRNSLSLTLVPIVNEASIIDMSLVNNYLVTPETEGGSVKKFIMLDNVTSGVPEGDEIEDLVCIASGTGTLSRLALYDENGSRLPGLTKNTETNTYTVPYTEGSAFYLYIESSGGDVNLVFNAILTSGGSTGGNVRVSISGAAAEAGKTVYFNIIPTLGTTTYLAAGSFVIEADGTGSGSALDMYTGFPVTLAEGTYYVQAYIDITGNAVTGFDGLDAGEPSYTSVGTAVTAAQTTIPLARGSFSGHVYYVSNSGSGANDGSTPANSTTLEIAINNKVSSNSADGQMNWIVLTENITTTNTGMYEMFASKPVSITSSGGTPYSITLGNTLLAGPFIHIPDNATLSLINAEIRGASGIYAVSGLILIEVNGTFNMQSGARLADNQVTGVTADGIGVKMNGGTFIMSDGIIFNCGTTQGNGGGVYLSGSTAVFQMDDGYIYDCSSSGVPYGGGGVCIGANGGTFTMNGGEINGCFTGGDGGGVHVVIGSFVMNGGIISANEAPAGAGGGVCITSGSMTLSGDSEITANKAQDIGGGVYMDAGLVGFTVSGTPSITANYITSAMDTNSGSGVFIEDGLAPGLAAWNALNTAACVFGNFFSTTLSSSVSNNLVRF